MTWELGPVIEKTETYEHRLARKNTVVGSWFRANASQQQEALAVRGAGPPWLEVLDAGGGWVVTEPDLSAGARDVIEVVRDDEPTPPEVLPPQIVSLAVDAGSVARRAGRSLGVIRFDWRGGIRLRPLTLPEGAFSDPLLETPSHFFSAFPQWDEARVRVTLMRWLGGNLPYLFSAHCDAEAWIEQPLQGGREEAVVAALDDIGSWQVLADALLERGHPRGALMALQLSGSDATATRNHLRRYPWLLPLAGPYTTLLLEHGFVGRLEYDVSSWSGWTELQQLLRHPAVRFLRTIHLRGPPAELPPTLRVLEGVGHRSVREFILPRVKRPERFVARLRRTFPRLERVVTAQPSASSP